MTLFNLHSRNMNISSDHSLLESWIFLNCFVELRWAEIFYTMDFLIAGPDFQRNIIRYSRPEVITR